MLYASTRCKKDAYTAHRVLMEDFAPDGGYFVPFRLPKLERSQLDNIRTQPFGETVAQILNLFFSVRLTGWDVECSIGKSATKIYEMNQKALLAELWHNPNGEFSYIANKLNEKLCAAPDVKISNWTQIAIRIAILFGIYGQLSKIGVEGFDVSVNSGDFSIPMSVWYACKMGLPVGVIVCVCNENSAPWDFLHRGELNFGQQAVQTLMRKMDFAIPDGLERLVYETLGYDETAKYVLCLQRKGVYQIRPDMVKQVNNGMFVSVVGKDRVGSVISSVYRSNSYLLDPYTAVSYGGLQDYRAKTGEHCLTLLLSEESPLLFADEVISATGLSRAQIETHLNES